MSKKSEQINNIFKATKDKKERDLKAREAQDLKLMEDLEKIQMRLKSSGHTRAKEAREIEALDVVNNELKALQVKYNKLKKKIAELFNGCSSDEEDPAENDETYHQKTSSSSSSLSGSAALKLPLSKIEDINQLGLDFDRYKVKLEEQIEREAKEREPRALVKLIMKCMFHENLLKLISNSDRGKLIKIPYNIKEFLQNSLKHRFPYKTADYFNVTIKDVLKHKNYL